MFFVSRSATFKFYVVGWVDASSVITFGDVDFFFATRGFDVDVGLGVTMIVVIVLVVSVTSEGYISLPLCRLLCFKEEETHCSLENSTSVRRSSR